jgi:hypothetical protein
MGNTWVTTSSDWVTSPAKPSVLLGHIRGWTFADFVRFLMLLSLLALWYLVFVGLGGVWA